MDQSRENINVNVIGYGNWGSRFAKKLELDGYQIDNLVTDKENVFVKCKNILKRYDIEKIDKNLPTFILTGPLYHHEIIPLFNSRVFVEKPFIVGNNKNLYYKNKPYVNYLWYNSSKIKKIKDLIPNNFENLDIDFISANNVDRKLTIIEDFLPHVISILNSLDLNESKLISVDKLDDYIYKTSFNLKDKNITFTFGFSDRTYTKFVADEKVIESNTYYSVTTNADTFFIDKEPLSESIERYYNYYLTGQCDETFISNDFHNLIYNLTYSYT